MTDLAETSLIASATVRASSTVIRHLPSASGSNMASCSRSLSGRGAEPLIGTKRIKSVSNPLESKPAAQPLMMASSLSDSEDKLQGGVAKGGQGQQQRHGQREHGMGSSSDMDAGSFSVDEVSAMLAKMRQHLRGAAEDAAKRKGALAALQQDLLKRQQAEGE